MPILTRRICLAASLGLFLSGQVWCPAATPLTSAFTYQGRLEALGVPYEGTADVRFRIFEVPTEGLQLTDQVFWTGEVTRGFFTVQVDFGPGVFRGDEAYLEIAVRTPAGSEEEFTTLLPRQRVSVTPYALYALTGNVGPQGPEGPPGPQGQEGAPGAKSWSELADIPPGFADGVDDVSATPYTAGVGLRLDGTEFGLAQTPVSFPLVTGGAGTVDSVGNFGLGTATPRAPLHVQRTDLALAAGVVGGNATAVFESGDSQVEVISGNSGTSSSAVNLREVFGDGSFSDLWSLAKRTRQSGGWLDLRYGNSDAEGGAALRLYPDADVDIGNPEGLHLGAFRSNLQARNGTNVTALNLNPDGGTVLVASGRNGNLGVGTVSATDRLTVDADNGEDAVRVRINGETKFRVNASGGVAVGSSGTGVAAGDLDVAGAVAVAGGDSALGENLIVKGDAQVGGDLEVAGRITGAPVERSYLIPESGFRDTFATAIKPVVAPLHLPPYSRIKTIRARYNDQWDSVDVRIIIRFWEMDPGALLIDNPFYAVYTPVKVSNSGDTMLVYVLPEPYEIRPYKAYEVLFDVEGVLPQSIGPAAVQIIYDTPGDLP